MNTKAGTVKVMVTLLFSFLVFAVSVAGYGRRIDIDGSEIGQRDLYEDQSRKQIKGDSDKKMTKEIGEDTSLVYKTVGSRELRIHLNFPPDWKRTDKRPVIVFFFGGGWRQGSVEHFAYQAKYFASRGIVAARADYRVKSRDNVTPDVCVEDARSAVRWIRKNAGSLGVDPNQLIASGGSSGGHLAASLLIKESVNDKQDDLSVPTTPQAMVLYNPVLDFTTLDGLIEQFKNETVRGLVERIKNDKMLATKISPTVHLDKHAPPAILFCGTEDFLLAQVNAYSKIAKKLGVRADMYLAEGQHHAFFNYSPWLERTTIAADQFLTSLGFLKGEPTLKQPSPAPTKPAEPLAVMRSGVRSPSAPPIESIC